MDNIPFHKIMESMKPKTQDDIKPHGKILGLHKIGEKTHSVPINRKKFGIDGIKPHGEIKGLENLDEVTGFSKLNEVNSAIPVNKQNLDIEPHGKILGLEKLDC